MYRLAPRQSEEPCAVLLVAFFLGEGLDWPVNSPQLSLIEGGQFLTDMWYSTSSQKIQYMISPSLTHQDKPFLDLIRQILHSLPLPLVFVPKFQTGNTWGAKNILLFICKNTPCLLCLECCAALSQIWGTVYKSGYESYITHPMQRWTLSNILRVESQHFKLIATFSFQIQCAWVDTKQWKTYYRPYTFWLLCISVLAIPIYRAYCTPTKGFFLFQLPLRRFLPIFLMCSVFRELRLVADVRL